MGEDNRHVNSVDADAVTLAAIQGLHEMIRQQELAAKRASVPAWKRPADIPVIVQ